MRTVAEHQAIVAQLLRPPAPAAAPLADAAGRVLATDVRAAAPLPGFDNSAMDGYAVRAADVAEATPAQPVRLPVAGDIPAGLVDVPALATGTTMRIMTGAPLPAGADAIVPVEATDGGIAAVAISEPSASGRHVRTVGEDVRAGEQVLRAGTVLGPSQLGLLAALGVATVEVLPPLTVLVLSTGSELVEPGTPLSPGQIYDANSLMLATAVEAAGARARRLHFVADDVAAFHAALAPQLTEVDLVLTSGGVSAGAYEVVKDALADEGVTFAKVGMQPGMPQGAGRVQGVPVICTPGNPVSALVSFEVFVRPALRAAMGLPHPRRPVRTARLTEAIESPGGRRQFRRARLDREHATVTPSGPPGSQFLRWLAGADALLDIPAEVTALEADAEVEVWDLTA